jgi:hypothetical protein
VRPALDDLDGATAASRRGDARPAPTPRGRSTERRIGRSVVLTSGGQAMAMATGGLMAVLIAARFGGSGSTDGFFAAYSVYGLVLLIAQSTRLTVVPRLIGGSTRFAQFDRYLLGLGVLWLGCGVVLVPDDRARRVPRVVAGGWRTALCRPRRGDAGRARTVWAGGGGLRHG